MKKIVKTKMMLRYIIKFIFRLAIFMSIFICYLWNKNELIKLLTTPVLYFLAPIHILWLIFMILMILHLFPRKFLSMALRKEKEEHFDSVENYSRLNLLDFVQKMNVRAWRVMLVWLTANACIGILYLFHLLKEIDLIMFTVFFFLCDYICILFFCPFQTYIMKNRCCVNCRIYDWGHFMMFTPMLFIKNFFSWSLFFTSLVVLIHWEIIYAKYPERFWHGSNKTLQCANCKDKTCQLKINRVKEI